MMMMMMMMPMNKKIQRTVEVAWLGLFLFVVAVAATNTSSSFNTSSTLESFTTSSEPLVTSSSMAPTSAGARTIAWETYDIHCNLYSVAVYEVGLCFVTYDTSGLVNYEMGRVDYYPNLDCSGSPTSFTFADSGPCVPGAQEITYLMSASFNFSRNCTSMYVLTNDAFCGSGMSRSILTIYNTIEEPACETFPGFMILTTNTSVEGSNSLSLAEYTLGDLDTPCAVPFTNYSWPYYTTTSSSSSSSSSSSVSSTTPPTSAGARTIAWETYDINCNMLGMNVYEVGLCFAGDYSSSLVNYDMGRIDHYPNLDCSGSPTYFEVADVGPCVPGVRTYTYLLSASFAILRNCTSMYVWTNDDFCGSGMSRGILTIYNTVEDPACETYPGFMRLMTNASIEGSSSLSLAQYTLGDLDEPCAATPYAPWPQGTSSPSSSSSSSSVSSSTSSTSSESTTTSPTTSFSDSSSSSSEIAVTSAAVAAVSTMTMLAVHLRLLLVVVVVGLTLA